LHGIEIENIPTILKRKQADIKPNKRAYLQGFKIEKVLDSAPYVGFTVDGNNLYIEGEHFTVIHNSGKTTAACAELAAHALNTPNGKALITAPILSQVTDAVIPELEKFLPTWFIEQRIKKPSPFYRLTNGFEIIVYASDDQQKLRSLNLTAFYIEEASGVDFEVFDQLMTRLRSKAGVIKDVYGNEVGYKYMGILSTNPESSWIRDDFLLVSDVIKASPSIDLSVYKNLINREKTNRHFHTFISSTRDNHHVPAQFIERMSAGKSEQWIRKYVDCYLDFREGAVFPEFNKHLVEPFELPKSWKHMAGYDPGFNDPTAVPKATIDPRNGIVYIYDDYKVSNQPMGVHAAHVISWLDGKELLYPIQADPSIAQRNNVTGVSYADYMRRQYGIRLEAGNNDIQAGIERIRDYMHAGKLKFFNNCNELKQEADRYVYPKDKKTNTDDKPVDKHNHLWDAIRYMIMRLPADPYATSKLVLTNDFYSFTGERKKPMTTSFKKTINGSKGTVRGGMKL
jgi:PBSX family phage terminase large subunit